MPSRRIDPHAEAARLLDRIPIEYRDDLATDPRTTIEVLFEDIDISTRPPSPRGDGCAVDGTYHPGPPPRIVVADDTIVTRHRFTMLHELGHHFLEHDGPLNELDVDNKDRRDEEICNEVAASVLIPADKVEALLPAGRFTARDVAKLYETVEGSRSACCVAAVRRLAKPGAVILGTTDGDAVFTAHHMATNWRIARGTPQGPDSVLAKAGRSGAGHVREVTRARFANGNSSGQLQGDAHVDADGWVFAVLVEDTVSPWATGLVFATADAGAEGEDIECERCGPVTAWRTCPKCRDKICPSCERCSCPVGPSQQRCTGYCGLMKPENQFSDGSTVCVDCE